MREGAPSGHLQPCWRGYRGSPGGGAWLKVCPLSSVLNRKRERCPDCWRLGVWK